MLLFTIVIIIIAITIIINLFFVDVEIAEMPKK